MRIQILPLPSVVIGEDVEEPFAIIIDQCPPEGISEGAEALWRQFAIDCGAKSAFATDETVEIVARYAEPEPAPVTASVDSERYEALRRDVAAMLDSLRQLTARPKMDLGMQISLPKDLDAEKVQRELRCAFGLCRDCGKSPCVCLRSAPCPDWSHEIEHDAHAWDAPVDGHVHCPGWPPVADGDEEPRERSLMDDLPTRLHPLAAAVGIPDRPVDPRERAREWIVGFHATTDEDRVNCVALLLGAADDALRCAVNHKARDGDAEPEPIGYTVVTVFDGRGGFIPPDTEDLETREEAVARQKILTERNPPHGGSWVACKVVPLVDEQEQG